MYQTSVDLLEFCSELLFFLSQTAEKCHYISISWLLTYSRQVFELFQVPGLDLGSIWYQESLNFVFEERGIAIRVTSLTGTGETLVDLLEESTDDTVHLNVKIHLGVETVLDIPPPHVRLAIPFWSPFVPWCHRHVRIVGLSVIIFFLRLHIFCVPAWCHSLVRIINLLETIYLLRLHISYVIALVRNPLPIPLIWPSLLNVLVDGFAIVWIGLLVLIVPDIIRIVLGIVAIKPLLLLHCKINQCTLNEVPRLLREVHASVAWCHWHRLLVWLIHQLFIYPQIVSSPLILILVKGRLSQPNWLYSLCRQHLSLPSGLLAYQRIVA